MKEDLYLLNEITRKGLFEIFEPLNDLTLVSKLFLEQRIFLDGICRVSNSILKLLNSFIVYSSVSFLNATLRKLLILWQ
jgi:hypothetical protein